MPKGYEYWSEDDNGNALIADDAPDWAKQEFEKYHDLMKKSGTPDENGVITDY